MAFAHHHGEASGEEGAGQRGPRSPSWPPSRSPGSGPFAGENAWVSMIHVLWCPGWTRLPLAFADARSTATTGAWPSSTSGSALNSSRKAQQSRRAEGPRRTLTSSVERLPSVVAFGSICGSSVGKTQVREVGYGPQVLTERCPQQTRRCGSRFRERSQQATASAFNFPPECSRRDACFSQQAAASDAPRSRVNRGRTTSKSGAPGESSGSQACHQARD
jgi:hypothetical protein